METVQAIINKEHKLDILSGAGIGIMLAERPISLPSWVPDFRGLPTVIDGYALHDDSFRAAGATAARVKFSTDLMAMEVQGILHDAINGVQPYLKDSRFPF
jgi:hypothetical protein